MYNSNLAYTLNEEGSFIASWDYFVKEIAAVFRFSKEEKVWFKNCRTAKLIAAIPFAANCVEPERTAISHLCIYIAEIRGFQKYFAHLPSDDRNVYNRLDCIATFEGGDQNVLSYGMNMLALIMIEGYHNSQKSDKENNIYNPLNSKKWNYEGLKKELEQKISCYSNSLLDSIFDAPINGWKE